MKKTLISSALLMVTVGVFAQGSVNFQNRVTSGTGAQGIIIAPVYGVEPSDNTISKTGQSAIGNPAGVQTYGGALLAGTGFTAQLWAGPVGGGLGGLTVATNGTTTFRTGGGAGYIVALVNAATTTVADGSGSRALLQLRAWDNRGGTIGTWQSVLADGTIPRGMSPEFVPQFDLGGGSVTPPNLIGLQSFNLFTVVPEPSLITGR